MNTKKKNLTKQICVLALLTAAGVVLGRLVPVINLWNTKIEFAFVAVMLAACISGPIGGAVVGALVDFIGAILMPTGAYFPGFTVQIVSVLEQVFSGAVTEPFDDPVDEELVFFLAFPTVAVALHAAHALGATRLHRHDVPVPHATACDRNERGKHLHDHVHEFLMVEPFDTSPDVLASVLGLRAPVLERLGGQFPYRRD